MRQEGGRPGPEIRPQVARADGSVIAPAVTVLLVRREPAADGDEFRHIARRTHDPRERYEAAIRLLSSTYYQYSDEFSDTLTALFGADSAVANTLAEERECVLHFGDAYRLPCSVSELFPHAPAYQATYWHNRLFNPDLPASVRVLAFFPRWE